MPDNYWTLQPEQIEHLIWSHWPVERVAYVCLAVLWLALWAQVSLMHAKGKFHSKYMWGPVVYTPLLVVTSLALTLFRVHMTEVLFIASYALGVIEGLFGTLKHLHGVREHEGGFTLRNFIQGPPALLPVIYVLLALIGLLVYYWDELVPGSKPYFEALIWMFHA